MFADKSMKVPVEPEPIKTIPPGFAVTVQFPVEGRPDNSTDPSGIAHVGWVIEPMIGALGAVGTALIAAITEAIDAHP